MQTEVNQYQIGLHSNKPYPKKNEKIRTKHVLTIAMLLTCTMYRITNVPKVMKKPTNINIFPTGIAL